jgi:hypothetical protein
MNTEYIVESDITIRAVDKPFAQRQPMGIFSSIESAYRFIEKYIGDTKALHTYFSRSFLCSINELEDRVANGKMVALNVVLGQFEDMIFITKMES